MRFYKLDNCVSAQIECAGINFRWKYTCVGITPDGWNNTKKKQPFTAKMFPKISLKMNYHTHQNDQWSYFDLSLFGVFRIWARSWGEKTKDYCPLEWGGLHFELFGKHVVFSNQGISLKKY